MVPRYFWLLLTTIVIATSISAQSSDIKWKLGSSGKVKWSNNCDFFGGDYVQKSGILLSSKCEWSGQYLIFLRVLLLSWLFKIIYFKKPIEWRLADGINGTYKWGYCDFPKSDMKNISMEDSTKCGSSCLNHNRCTHFAHFNGKCYLKTISGPARKPIYKPDRICGFLVERVYNNKTVCPDKCLANKRCTHFVHSTPILPHQCILKEIRGNSVVEMMNEKAPLCGYVVWYIDIFT